MKALLFQCSLYFKRTTKKLCNLSACAVSSMVSRTADCFIKLFQSVFDHSTEGQEIRNEPWMNPLSKLFSIKIWIQKSSRRWPVKIIRWLSDWSCNMSGSPTLYPANTQRKLDITGHEWPLWTHATGLYQVEWWRTGEMSLKKTMLLLRKTWPLSRTMPFLCQGWSQTTPCREHYHHHPLVNSESILFTVSLTIHCVSMNATLRYHLCPSGTDWLRICWQFHQPCNHKHREIFPSTMPTMHQYYLESTHKWWHYQTLYPAPPPASQHIAQRAHIFTSLRVFLDTPTQATDLLDR